MSHQTGIRANEELKKFFGKCRDGNIRVFQVSIIDEQLVLTASRDVIGNWEEDYDSCVGPLVEPDQPSYIVYRLDSKNTSGYDWLFISWSPDSSSIRQKMLYASTKATLKQEFGSGQIKEELHASSVDDMTLNGYRSHKRAAVAPAPLTAAEEELRRAEVDTSVSIDSRLQTLVGVAFPLTSEAWQALTSLRDKACNYVQLRIDLDEEMIHLSEKSNVSVAKLPGKVPSDCVRYHLYNYEHTHEGDYLETLVFIYSMPGYSCSIKERMLYSSCKNPLSEIIEKQIGLPIAKKLQINCGKELTEEFLQDEIHPKKNLHRPKFSKPKGPPNRGAKRLTKSQQETNNE